MTNPMCMMILNQDLKVAKSTKDYGESGEICCNCPLINRIDYIIHHQKEFIGGVL